MSNDFINDAAQKLFAKEVDKSLIEAVEKGNFAQTLWDQVLESGFTQLFCKEQDGGIEATWEDAYPILYHLGYHQAPLPVAETAIARLILSAAEQSLDTERPICIAAHAQAKLARDDAGLLQGEIQSVKWARHASWCLVTLSPKDIALFDLSAQGVQIVAGVDTSNMPSDRLLLSDVTPHAVFSNPFSNLEDAIQTFGAGARAVMMVGALEFALDQSVQYAKDRVQFGKPIGKNQAIQQQLALMAGEVAIARASAYMACKDMPDVNRRISEQAQFSVAAAKICAGDAVSNGTSIAHQVHGAIGFTYEHALNFATRRLWAWRGDFGNATSWARRIGQAYAKQPGAMFWHHLTKRVLPVGAQQ